jgi:hypothetical protein
LNADNGFGSHELADVLEREIYWELRDPHADDPDTVASYHGLAAKLGLYEDGKPNGRT